MKRLGGCLPSWAVGVLLAVALAGGSAAASAAAQGDAVDLNTPLRDLKLEQQPDGQIRVLIDTPTGQERLTPQAFLDAVDRSQKRHQQDGFLFTLFNITSWHGVLWVTLGLMGQVLFTGRMIVQWLVSEKERRSVVPPVFWWMSLLGATMLILYFIWRKDIVGFIGQATGWMIYTRNLWMIYFPDHSRPTIADDPAPEPEISR
ncbi:MAG TPA: lipid-A-disaccharide synthase N-terminal domain-containing protein [Phycisphaeraceae bacterium]